MEKIIQIQKENAQLQKHHYFEEILFSYQWWILITITVTLWVLWAVLVDKKRLKSILIVGFITSQLAIILDDIGVSLALWTYPYKVIYFTSRLNTVDITIIPVTYMLLYQYFRSWKSYLIVLALFCLFAAFVAEPIFVKLSMYKLLSWWEFWHSSPGYMLIGIFVKWLVDKLDRYTQKWKFF
ncbi:CBO0543 family protein [Halobacillus amylolyticus]|uniref:Uncharacterized protein n=1 Tax=Halobacillus amylolyticus TaxID=2932259 RepID=A0ABY4HDQ9_9BACI|nr:CBO0543 family protein [Halobacillus amylolyticus]UOR12552.1 hypothetical protein MUO15_03260 [Halobacillus amylolyticus]